MEVEILQRAHPVLVAELDPEGVLDGLRGCAVAAAGVAHEDEDVLGAVGPELDDDEPFWEEEEAPSPRGRPEEESSPA